MLNAIHAAEVQYRHDSARLDREHLLLARIAERAAAPTPTSRHRFTAPEPMAERATPGLAARHHRARHRAGSVATSDLPARPPRRRTGDRRGGARLLLTDAARSENTERPATAASAGSSGPGGVSDPGGLPARSACRR